MTRLPQALGKRVHLLALQHGLGALDVRRECIDLALVEHAHRDRILIAIAARGQVSRLRLQAHVEVAALRHRVDEHLARVFLDDVAGALPELLVFEHLARVQHLALPRHEEVVQFRQAVAVAVLGAVEQQRGQALRARALHGLGEGLL
eukprot:CAMPEP_0115831062 /NCGR_PEP_ID=MMETSP0287-20121206/1944_1 /TAXON_ID=412157 /ORGANISM="Chrysochromulina rotalis, Strain UIO044" /LENGTH=147 /DNA_ID=CAMNT_0003284395 /DNA_START=434 /DNA_END=874 /DNA_ORIENTATION=-